MLNFKQHAHAATMEFDTLAIWGTERAIMVNTFTSSSGANCRDIKPDAERFKQLNNFEHEFF
jgi:hypothetical protein